MRKQFSLCFMVCLLGFCSCKMTAQIVTAPPIDSEVNEFEVHQDTMLYLKTVKITYTLTNAARIQQVIDQKAKEKETSDMQWFELKQLHNKAVAKEKAIVKRKKP
jgi:hypothetical protein